MTNQEMRKRLIITRHIAKMTPEQIGRRFIVSYAAPPKPKNSGQHKAA